MPNHDLNPGVGRPQLLDNNTSGASCLGPLAGLAKQRVIYEATVKTMADAAATTLVLVSRPQLAALREAEHTAKELRARGVSNQRLVINGAFETPCPKDVTAQAMQQRGVSALASTHAFISSLPSFLVPLRPINILGLSGLSALLDGGVEPVPVTPQHDRWTPPDMGSLEALVATIERQGHRP